MGLRPGQARIEFLATEERLNQLLDQGHTMRSAYEEMKKAGFYTASYEAIYKLYRGITKQRVTIKRAGVKAKAHKIVTNDERTVDSKSPVIIEKSSQVTDPKNFKDKEVF